MELLPQPISYLDIRLVAADFGFAGELEDFIEIMMAADSTWMDCYQAQRSASKQK